MPTVTVRSKRATATQIEDEEKWPDEIYMEVQQLRSYSVVEEGSIRVFADCTVNLSYIVTCLVHRDQGVENEKIGVRLSEPVALIYNSSIGVYAPSVYSEREDFPRLLPHCNPVADDSPVSLCLSRTGVQPVYDQGGVVAIVERVAQWLFDAAYDNLDKDGWEPIPQVCNFSARVDIAALQNVSYKKSGAFKQPLSWKSHSLANQTDKRLTADFFDVSLDISSGATYPWSGFYIGGDKACTPTYSSESISTEDQLLELADSIGSKRQLEYVFSNEINKLSSLETGLVPLLLIFGVWRTKPLRRDIPGQSSNENARHVEPVAFLLFYNKAEQNFNCEEVYCVNLWAKNSTHLLAKLSGREKVEQESIGVVGCGAIGSVLAKNFIRSGYDHLTLVDPDHFLPHNVARHYLSSDFIGANKALALKNIFTRDGVECAAYPTSLNFEILRNLHRRTRCIINSSTNRHVRNILATYSGSNSVPVAEMFIADSGKLGICLTENADRTSRIDDVHSALYDLAYINELIRRWLHQSADMDGVALGLGCASNTMILPLSRVEAITGNFTPIVERISERDTGLIVISECDAGSGLIISSDVYEVPAFDEIELDYLGGVNEGWSCRISKDVRAYIQQCRADANPIETGGFLYGRMNTITKTVTVIRALEVEPLENSEVRIILPPSSKCGEHKSYMRKTCSMTLELGSWHTHPSGSAVASATDFAAMKQATQYRENMYKPSLAIIAGANNDISGTLIFPQRY